MNKDLPSLNSVKYDILSRLASGSCDYVELLNLFPDPSQADTVLKALLFDKLVEGKCEAYGRISITSPGVLLLAELQQAATKETEEKKQQAFQNKVSVAQVLVPAVTFLLGLFVEHYAGILRFLGL